MNIVIVDSKGKQLTDILRDRLEALGYTVHVVKDIPVGVARNPFAMIILADGNSHLKQLHLLEKVEFSVLWCYRPGLDAHPERSKAISGFFSRASLNFIEEVIAFLVRLSKK